MLLFMILHGGGGDNMGHLETKKNTKNHFHGRSCYLCVYTAYIISHGVHCDVMIHLETEKHKEPFSRTIVLLVYTVIRYKSFFTEDTVMLWFTLRQKNTSTKNHFQGRSCYLCVMLLDLYHFSRRTRQCYRSSWDQKTQRTILKDDRVTCVYCYTTYIYIYIYKTHGLSPRANYTNRATAACWRSDCQFLRIEGVTWSAWRIPTVVFSVF
jgi:hypothetical protein